MELWCCFMGDIQLRSTTIRRLHQSRSGHDDPRSASTASTGRLPTTCIHSNARMLACRTTAATSLLSNSRSTSQLGELLHVQHSHNQTHNRLVKQRRPTRHRRPLRRARRHLCHRRYRRHRCSRPVQLRSIRRVNTCKRTCSLVSSIFSLLTRTCRPRRRPSRRVACRIGSCAISMQAVTCSLLIRCGLVNEITIISTFYRLPTIISIFRMISYIFIEFIYLLSIIQYSARLFLVAISTKLRISLLCSIIVIVKIYRF
jgi:hypothetical protein